MNTLLRLLPAFLFALVSATQSPADRIRLPYGTGPEIDSTYGQLTKQSEVVLVGVVASVSTGEIGLARLNLLQVEVLFGPSISTNFYSVTVAGQLRDIHPPQRALIYATSKDAPASLAQTYRWGWTEESIPATPGATLRVADGERGIIPIPTAETGLLAVAKGYISNLRGSSGNATSYFRFLHGLLASDDDRVSKDARVDLVFLCRYLDPDALESLCASQADIDPEIRDYADGIADWKKRGSPVAIRDLTPNEEETGRWIGALKTADHSGKTAALLELMEPARREWLRQSTSIWVAVVADLLRDTDNSVRFAAAELLSEVDDKRATPVLLDGLESDRSDIRKESWGRLVKLYGNQVSYDPEAPKEERTASAALWKAWYERQSHDHHRQSN